MTRTDRLELGGWTERALSLDRDELARVDASAQVEDVARVMPGRAGRAVRLAALFERARPKPGATHLDVESADPGFAVSVPLAEVAGALVLYELDGAALPDAKGGPFRLLVPGHADECVHVKSLARLALSTRRGRDTRPADDAAHRALHAKKKG